jgi:hypothetical protein
VRGFTISGGEIKRWLATNLQPEQAATRAAE